MGLPSASYSGSALAGLGGLRRRLRETALHDRRLEFPLFRHLVAEGGVKVDHVAQQDLFAQKFLAPDGDGLKCQRAFAEPRDHRVAPGLDALGDRDLSLARQQLDRAHLAQVHAHRVVGAIELFLPAGERHIAAALGFHQIGRAFVLLLGLFVVLGHLNAHLRQHGHHIFDLVGTDLIGRENLVELVIRDVTALLGLGDHLLDRSLTHVEADILLLRVRLGLVIVLGCHAHLLIAGRMIRSTRITSAVD